MIVLLIVLTSVFTFIAGFITGYMFLRTKLFYGGELVIDDDNNLCAQFKSENVVDEGNFITLKIIKDKS